MNNEKLPGCHYNQFDPSTLNPLNETTRMRINESYLLDFDFSGKTVLDIGCNLGLFSLIAARRGASKVKGVDITKSFISQSCENAAVYYSGLNEQDKASFNVEFEHVGFSSLDISYRSDVVLCYEVIHWLTAQGIPLAESIAKLRMVTGSDLLLETPWDVSERSLTQQTTLSAENYNAEMIFRELLKHFQNIRVIRFTGYMQDLQAKRFLIHAS